MVGDLNVAGLTLQVADTAGLSKNTRYTIATCTGTLTGPFANHNLPSLWVVRYNTSQKKIDLGYPSGTLIRVR